MSEVEAEIPVNLMTMASRIVQAYVARNHIQQAELPALLSTIHETLLKVSKSGVVTETPVENRPTPHQIRKSIQPDHLVSFEDGKSYKTLKRHLTRLGLTSDEYRQKWGLPHDYPMVAASYSERRSELARSAGLGQHRKKDQASA